jgi:hypothetical protein
MSIDVLSLVVGVVVAALIFHFFLLDDSIECDVING